MELAYLRAICRSMVPRSLWDKLRACWATHKVRRVEEICLREMVAASEHSPSLSVAPTQAGRSPLRRILLIADVMWEANELVPELQLICQVSVHDLRPMLRAKPHDPAAEIAKSVDRFARDSGNSPPDLVLLYLRGNLLSEELFSVIRKHWSCPLVGMNLDDKVSFWDYGYAGGGDHYQKWASSFDLNLTNSKIASTWYSKTSSNCVYMPPAMKRPKDPFAPSSSNFRYPLSFVGSPKLDREIVINRIRELGLPVSVFGKGWAQGEWVSDPVVVYRQSQINIGLGMATPSFSTTKNRDFECPGVGACYLTTFNWELAEWWDIGKEILCYRNVEELVELACWYRNRPDECLNIAQAAWRRGMSEHTWEVRFRKLFREMGFTV